MIPVTDFIFFFGFERSETTFRFLAEENRVISKAAGSFWFFKDASAGLAFKENWGFIGEPKGQRTLKVGLTVIAFNVFEICQKLVVVLFV